MVVPATPSEFGICNYRSGENHYNRHLLFPHATQIQRAAIRMVDGLLSRRLAVDVVQRQGDFDEIFGGFDGGILVLSPVIRAVQDKAIGLGDRTG